MIFLIPALYWPAATATASETIPEQTHLVRKCKSHTASPETKLLNCNILLEQRDSLDPITLGEVYRGRATAYLINKEYDHAIADATAAIDINPGDPRNYVKRGVAHHGKAQYLNAVADFTKALELREDLPLVSLYRAKSHKNIGNQTLAFEDFRIFIKAEQRNLKWVWKGLLQNGYIDAGLPMTWSEQLAEALKKCILENCKLSH